MSMIYNGSGNCISAAGLPADKYLLHAVDKYSNPAQQVRITPTLINADTSAGELVVTGTGEIHTAVVSYIATDRSRLEKPEIVGVIRLETPGYRQGSYEFAGLFHKLCGVTEEDVKTGRAIGMKLKARWKPPEERRGSILDIECFEPITSQEGGGEQ